MIKENSNIQCVVLCATNTDLQKVYGNEVVNKLNKAGITTIADYSKKTLSYKIRQYSLPKLKTKPYVIILGDREIADGTITVRNTKEKTANTVTVELFIEQF